MFIYLTFVSKMVKIVHSLARLPLFLVVLIISNLASPPNGFYQLQAQSYTGILTEDGYEPRTLVQDVLLSDGCFQIIEPSISGSGHMGTFFRGESSIRMSEGIILSTGDIRNAHGPNDEYNTKWQKSFNPKTPDADLDGLLPSAKIYDKTTLEFDFIATGNTVQFRYVFASDEYCEYAGSKFNDVFGFFISGPGINGPFSNNADNIALIPGTSDYVSINTVNHYSNETYYTPNVLPRWISDIANHDPACNDHPAPVALSEIEYDGFTSILTATAQVQPCEQYHIKLVIADIQDDDYDSAVFLEAKSFTAGNAVQVRTIVDGVTNDAIQEGCSNGGFLFERAAGQDMSTDETITFTFAPNNTATVGDDFTNISTTITIPAGQPSIELPVEVFSDDLVEGFEQFGIEFVVPCGCGFSDTARATFTIIDALSFSIDSSQITTCQGPDFSIMPTVFGGKKPYQYEWSTLATAESIVVPTTDSTYYVTVTDDCNNRLSTHINIDIVNNYFQEIDTTICSEASIVIDDMELFPNDNRTFNYTTANGCDSTIVVHVFDTGLMANIATADVACDGDSTGSIHIDFVTGGTPPYQYQISSDNYLETDSIAQQLTGGTYVVDIVDADQCTWQETVTIGTPEIWEIDAGGEVSLLLGQSVKLTVTESENVLGRLDYQWVPTTGLSCANCFNPVVTIEEDITYTITATDEQACQKVDTLLVRVRELEEGLLVLPTAFSPNNDQMNDVCKVQYTGEIIAFEYRIFNRWGQQVFFTDQPEEGWDGLQNGKLADIGWYAYQVHAIFIDSMTKEQMVRKLQGGLMLVR